MLEGGAGGEPGLALSGNEYRYASIETIRYRESNSSNCRGLDVKTEFQATSQKI